MAAKPQNLCYLTAGKALGAFKDFVATWNWIVSFVSNLKGEGDDQDPSTEDRKVWVDKSQDDYPVIRGGGSGSGGGSSVKTKKLTLQSGDESNIRFITEENDDEIIVKINVFWK